MAHYSLRQLIKKALWQMSVVPFDSNNRGAEGTFGLRDLSCEGQILLLISLNSALIIVLMPFSQSC
jgi:hypothetical protein